MPALSNALTAIARTLQGAACVASGSMAPGRKSKSGTAVQRNSSLNSTSPSRRLPSWFSTMAQSAEPSLIEAMASPDVVILTSTTKAWVGAMQMLQQGREIGADDVVADRHDDAPLLLRERTEGLLLRRGQLTRRREEVRAVGREADEARRAVEQAAAQRLFQAPDLQAHGRLAQVGAAAARVKLARSVTSTKASTAAASNINHIHLLSLKHLRPLFSQ